MKKLLALIAAAATAVAFAVPMAAAGFDAPSYILMEAYTGTVLLEKNADEALPPASVTKIMTILLVMDAIADGRLSLDEKVQTSEYAASMGGSQVYLEPGEEMTVHEMLKCVIVSSANDAAVALAEKVSGSEEAFVAAMNERAAGLGMTNTLFKNTNGLDDDVEGHLTSARDIAIMSRELITKHPQVLEYSSIWMDTVRDGAFGLTNTNRLVRFYRGANGLKTGSTSKAGFCMSATALRDGMQLIAVVMAAPTRDERNETAKKLLDYGFAGYEVAELGIDGAVLPLKVAGGVENEVALGGVPGTAVLKKGRSAKVERKIYLPDYIPAPVETGDTVGKAEFLLDGEIISTVPITAQQTVKKIGYAELLRRFIREMAMVSV